MVEGGSLEIRFPEFAERIQRLARGRGITIPDIKRALGVTPEMARRYWLGVSKPRDDKLLKLATLLGTTAQELDWTSTAGHFVAEEPRYVYIQRLDAIGGLGKGRHNEHVEVSGSHAYRSDWVMKNGWDPSQLAVISGEGDSMSPTINHGDVVLINLADTKLKSGDVYAIEDADGTRIKRLFKQLDGRVRVVSDNPDKRLHPDDYLTPDTGAHLVGKVVYRSGAV
jgi:phage repressor protein C with HTH and peptisase S24 domain